MPEEKCLCHPKEGSENCGCRNFFKGDGAILRVLAYIANIGVILFALFILKEAYGPERFLALLLMVPPILSILALRKQGDKEERALKKRIRKAYLRKELKALSEFDS